MADSANNQDANDAVGALVAESRQDAPQPRAALTTVNTDDPLNHCHRKKSTFDVVTRIFEIIAAVIVGTALVVVGFLQYTVYTRQAGIMEIEQRPWISLESIEILSGLTFKTVGAEFSIGYELKNVGHSPSFNTRFYAVVTPTWFAREPGSIAINETGDDSMIVPNITDNAGIPSVLDVPNASRILCEQEFEIMRLKEKIRNQNEQLKGQHVGLDYIAGGNVILPDKSLKGTYGITSENTANKTDRPEKAKSYALLVTACIQYIDPASNKAHFAPYQYMLLGSDPQYPWRDATLAPNQNEVPASSLHLRLGGQYAD